MSDNNILDNFEKEIDEIKSMRENNSQAALEKLDLLHKKIQDELKIAMQSGNRSAIRSLMQAQQKIISEITLKSYKKLKLKKGLKVYALVKAISIVGK